MGRKKKNKPATVNNQVISNWLFKQIMSPSRKYDVMDNIIENIYEKCVKLDEEETKALNARFGMVIKNFVEKMKEVDATFKEIFSRIHFTGSFFDGLRITEATEFDLNLVLKPNIPTVSQRKNRPPGFTSIVVCSGIGETPYKDWISPRGSQYLLNPELVRWWLQGVVMKTLEKIDEEGKLFFGCQLKVRQSGPAWTLSVTSEEAPSKTIDIDLVPVLEFTTAKRGMNPHLKKQDIRKVGLDEPWFAVPKPPNNCPYCHGISWRMSFPIQETAIIQDLKFFKYTLKMIKKVRDVLGIHEVASYHIKNLFLLELQKYGSDMWAENRRGLLFMHMLECLRKALESGKIPFIWNENCNLIGNVSKATLANRAGRLKGFCEKINRLIEKKKDPEEQKKNHEQLKIWIESLLNPPQDKKKPDDQEKRKDKDSDSETGTDSESDTDTENETHQVSHAKGLKAVETLMEYISQQGGTAQDITVLRRWEMFARSNKNKDNS